MTEEIVSNGQARAIARMTNQIRELAQEVVRLQTANHELADEISDLRRQYIDDLAKVIRGVNRNGR